MGSSCLNDTHLLVLLSSLCYGTGLCLALIVQLPVSRTILAFRLASFPGFPLRTSGARIKRDVRHMTSHNWEPIVTQWTRYGSVLTQLIESPFCYQLLLAAKALTGDCCTTV